MPPFRSSSTDQRTSIDEDHPHSQFRDRPSLHRHLRPGAAVGEGAEQPDVLQVLHVGNVDVEALQPAPNFQAAGNDALAIMYRSQICNLPQDVEEGFKHCQKRCARAIQGAMQRSLDHAFGAAGLLCGGNGSIHIHRDIWPLHSGSQIGKSRDKQSVPDNNGCIAKHHFCPPSHDSDFCLSSNSR